MMKKLVKKIMLGALASLAISSTAFANDTQVYVGLEGGAANMDFNLFPNVLPNGGDLGLATISNTSSSTNSNSAYGNIHIGFLTPVSDDWSLGGQLGFADYGKVDSTQTEAITNTPFGLFNSNATTTYHDTYKAITAEIVAQREFDQIFLNLHAGLADFLVDQTASSSMVIAGTPIPVDTSAQNGHSNVATAMGGVEVGYELTEHFNIYANYTVIARSGTNFQVPLINSLGLGVNYVF